MPGRCHLLHGCGVLHGFGVLHGCGVLHVAHPFHTWNQGEEDKAAGHTFVSAPSAQQEGMLHLPQ